MLLKLLFPSDLKVKSTNCMINLFVFIFNTNMFKIMLLPGA